MQSRRIPLKLLAPIAAGLALSVAILVFAEIGHRRLEAASGAVADSFAMQAAIHEVSGLVNAAETGQRGFLLTGRPEYLEPYTAAVPHIEGAMRRLRERVRNADAEQRERVARLNALVGKKLLELESTLLLYRTAGRDAAFELLGTDLGRRTMDEVRETADGLVNAERAGLATAVAGWQQDINTSRFGMHVLTGSTIALLLAVWFMAGREMALRMRTQTELAENQRRLEGLVESRTAELSELSDYLHEVSEKEKSRIARDIHDELGSILVSAKMDVSWVAARLVQADPPGAARLERVLATLDDGVEIKRRLIEELRPTLLDNLGLGAALQWQVGEVCGSAGLDCAVNVPDDDEVEYPPDIAIALFRIVQEALTNTVRYAKASRVTVDLARDAEAIHLVIHDDGIGIPPGAIDNRLSHGLLGMRQRVRALKGDFSIRGGPGEGTTVRVRVPAHSGRAANAVDADALPA